MITPSFGLTATERVLPKLALDFTTASLDSRITFTRTTGASNPATYVNSSGVLTAATNNQPRFDYDPVTLACKGLLIEEARTNLMLYSSAYNTGVANMWGPVSITFTTGQLAPDGTNTALQCRQDNTTSAVIASGISNEPTITSGATVTYTQYFKYTNTRWLLLQLSPPSGSASAARLRGWFDLQNGVVGSVANVSPATGCTISMTPAPNGYYRCTITGALNDSLVKARPLWIVVDGDGSINRAPTNSSYIAWGSQWENANFATSYIPTTTTALTRNADVATMTGTNFSDWFNASEGTFVAQYIPKDPAPSNARGLFIADDGTGNNLVGVSVTTNLRGTLNLATGGSGGGAVAANSGTVNQVNTIAGAYKVNDYAAALNAGTVATSVSLTLPTVTQARIGFLSRTGLYANATIQNLAFYPVRGINAQVQAQSK